MTVVDIEQLVIERANQRSEEVFGLLLSLLLESNEGSGIKEVVVDGSLIPAVVSAEIVMGKDGKIHFKFKRRHPRGEILSDERVYDNLETKRSGDDMRICFDTNNYIVIIDK